MPDGDLYAAGYDLGYKAALSDVAAECDRVHGSRSLLVLLEQLQRRHATQTGAVL